MNRHSPSAEMFSRFKAGQSMRSIARIFGVKTAVVEQAIRDNAAKLETAKEDGKS